MANLITLAFGALLIEKRLIVSLPRFLSVFRGFQKTFIGCGNGTSGNRCYRPSHHRYMGALSLCIETIEHRLFTNSNFHLSNRSFSSNGGNVPEKGCSSFISFFRYLSTANYH